MNTKIHYMYRDASNYKIQLSEVISGELTNDDLTALPIDLDVFYPEKVGFDATTFASAGYDPYDDDPDFHELYYVELTNEEPTVNITAEQFIEALLTGACKNLQRLY